MILVAVSVAALLLEELAYTIRLKEKEFMPARNGKIIRGRLIWEDDNRA